MTCVQILLKYIVDTKYNNGGEYGGVIGGSMKVDSSEESESWKETKRLVDWEREKIYSK